MSYCTYSSQESQCDIMIMKVDMVTYYRWEIQFYRWKNYDVERLNDFFLDHSEGMWQIWDSDCGSMNPRGLNGLNPRQEDLGVRLSKA